MRTAVAVVHMIPYYATLRRLAAAAVLELSRRPCRRRQFFFSPSFCTSLENRVGGCFVVPSRTGGFANVYRAEHLATGNVYVLKRMTVFKDNLLVVRCAR